MTWRGAGIQEEGETSQLVCDRVNTETKRVDSPSDQGTPESPAETGQKKKEEGGEGSGGGSSGGCSLLG